MKLIRLSAPVIVMVLLTVMVASCAPVLDKKLMEEGSREVSFAALREQPVQYERKTFIMGGVIVRTEFSEAGLLIEAVHVPVGPLGQFEDSGRSEGRFLALLSKGAALRDPGDYRIGRRMTLAGEFLGTRTGKIEGMDYVYPLFRIRQFYLWPYVMRYNPPLAFYDPWFSPYPYDYRHPWWYDPQRTAPVPVQPASPHRPPPPPASEKEHGGELERK